jgi:hypothetical protein
VSRDLTELGQLATRQRRRAIATVLTKVERLGLSPAQLDGVKAAVRDALAVYHDFVLDAIAVSTEGEPQIWNHEAMEILARIEEAVTPATPVADDDLPVRYPMQESPSGK